MARILIIEDQLELVEFLNRILAKDNHIVDFVTLLEDAKEALKMREYEVVMIDRRLPDGDGISIVNICQKLTPAPRTIIVSALDQTQSRIEGLDAGADDYIVKPYEPDELRARVRAVLRRPEKSKHEVIKLGNLAYIRKNREFSIDERSLVLPRRELLILEKLVENSGRVVTKDNLEDEVYGIDQSVQSNSLEVQMSRLRKKLVKAEASVNIHTIRGIGYLIKQT